MWKDLKMQVRSVRPGGSTYTITPEPAFVNAGEPLFLGHRIVTSELIVLDMRTLCANPRVVVVIQFANGEAVNLTQDPIRTVMPHNMQLQVLITGTSDEGKKINWTWPLEIIKCDVGFFVMKITPVLLEPDEPEKPMLDSADPELEQQDLSDFDISMLSDPGSEYNLNSTSGSDFGESDWESDEEGAAAKARAVAG